MKRKGDARMARRLKRESNALQWQDVDATQTNTGPRLSLPPALLRDRVFPFLAPLPSVEDAACDGIDLDAFQTQLAPLRAVCQQWYKLAQFLLVEGSKCVYTITFETGKKTEWNRILKRATREGGDHVQQLVLSMGEFDSYTNRFDEWFYVFEGDVAHDATWWTRLLRHFPAITRLDLTEIAASTHPAVLAAAATSCPLVNELVLRTDSVPRRPESIAALTAALREWHNANGGLRYLTVPIVPNGTVAYASLLADVAAHCPGIEYLERYKPNPHVTHHEPSFAPTVPMDVWSEFCRRCTKLRAFDWQFAPFTTQHLAAFVAVAPQSQLESLTFELSKTPGLWRDVTDLSPILAVVAHTPALRFFELFIKGSPVVNAMATDAQDELVRHVAHHCPFIEAFTCIDSRMGDQTAVVSGDAIVALARNGSLRYLNVWCVCLKDDTLVDLLKGMLQTPALKRLVDIDPKTHAHSAVLNFLKCLEHAPVDPFVKSTLELYVDGEFEEEEIVPGQFPALQRLESRTDLERLVKSIQQKYAPWLSYIRVEVSTYNIGVATIETITGLDLLINVSRSRVDDEYFDCYEDGRRAMKGGVFGVVEWSTRVTDGFAVWDSSTR